MFTLLGFLLENIFGTYFPMMSQLSHVTLS